MKLLSWNILIYITKDQDIITKTQHLIEEIIKIDPDVLLLQEASEYFLTQLCSNSTYIRTTEVLTHGGLCCTLIKNHILISNVKQIDTTGVSIQIDNLTIINCHLVPYYKNQLFRVNQVKHLLLPNTILMGDMNMNNNQHLEHNGIYDVAVSLEKKLSDTWFLSYHNKHSTISKRFSRVYTDKQVLSYQVYNTYKYLSDHIPISIII